MSASDHRQQLGARGEEAAVRYLVSRGYRIIERNWRCKLGEVDVLAMDGELLVVVEVRTKMSERFGTGAESVDARKQHKLRQLALTYMRMHNLSSETRLRFDVVSIRVTPKGSYEIDHIDHAF